VVVPAVESTPEEATPVAETAAANEEIVETSEEAPEVAEESAPAAAEANEPEAATETVAAEAPAETVAAEARSEAQPVPEEPVEEPEPRAGLTEEGRATNDPRVAAKTVEVVEITTTHRELFSDNVAAPAQSGGKAAPRAENDPRGPLTPTPLAEAAGQS